MKIISVIGARPQFIKLKPIVDELKKRKINHILVHTGQHYDYEMSKIFFDELNVPKPDYNLEVGSYSHAKQTALMLERIEKVLLKEKPNTVIVYGDTNSTLAGALGAVKLNIPVAHIEAGLRSYKSDMPEEVNRVLTDHISKFLFCPTKTAVDNLKKEGITKGVHLVGDVMYDIFKSKINSEFNSGPKPKTLQKLNLKSKEYFLLTIHRQENTDNPENLRSILFALKQIKKKIVFPMHPRTRKTLKQLNSEFSLLKGTVTTIGNFLIMNPVSYLDMLVLEKNAKKILTDSGGVQKEAYWLSIPCITLRKETEWMETVKNGWNILVGTDVDSIIRAIRGMNVDFSTRQFYGKGNAATKIVDTLAVVSSI
jgi:UDP-N-acetylglucosamine 2-epimerase